MIRSKILILFVLTLLGSTSAAWSQFQYFGVEEQFVLQGDNMSQLSTSLSYLKQVSARHGFGVELNIPFLLQSDRSSSVSFSSSAAYDVGLIWKRGMLPSVGGRYRLFVGNSFFIGAGMQVGLIHERFFADRYYNDENTVYPPISPVYLDYSLLSPYLRLNFETGFVWNMGNLLFGTLVGRVGPQFTHSRAPLLGSFTTSASTPTDFYSVHGANFQGGIALGMGVKL